MSLREKINNQFNQSLKNKDKTLISTLRLILAGIKERDIAKRTAENKQDVKDSEILQLLKKMKKQRQESANLYQKAGRQELLDIENNEIKVIDSFLPKQLNEEETEKLCKQLIESLKATSIKDMGKIMGALKQNHADDIDFSKAGLIIKKILS